MKVLQVKCPRCNQPIYSKVKDGFFYCDNCKVMHTRNGGIKEVPLEIAKPLAKYGNNALFAPFWRVECMVTILRSDVSGGLAHKLSKWIKGGSNQGLVNIFVPAGELDLNTQKQWAMRFLQDPPVYEMGKDFGPMNREASRLTQEEAEKMADFIIITMEAEKPGVLQSLDYTLEVKSAKLIYLPFLLDQGGRRPAWV